MNFPVLTTGAFIEDLLAMSIWVLSSVGRASPLQGEGRGFESLSTHHVEW